MGWLGVAISAIAAWLLWDENMLWFAVSVGVGVVALWSWGVMHNHAVTAAKRRPDYSGKFFDFTASEANAVPDWLAMTNMAAFIAAIVLLIIGVII